MLLRWVLRHVAEVDHRRAGSGGEHQEHRKVAVGGDDDQLVASRRHQDHLVAGLEEAEVSDVNRLDTTSSQHLDQSR